MTRCRWYGQAREITIDEPSPADFDALGAAVQQEAIEAGAAPSTLDLRIDYVADRRTLRAVATGAIGLTAGATLDAEHAFLARRGRRVAGRPLRRPARRRDRRLLAHPARPGGHLVVVDRFGDPVLDVIGEVIDDVETLSDQQLAERINEAVKRRSRSLGPAQIAPGFWVLSGARLAGRRPRTRASSSPSCAHRCAIRDHRKELKPWPCTSRRVAGIAVSSSRSAGRHRRPRHRDRRRTCDGADRRGPSRRRAHDSGGCRRTARRVAVGVPEAGERRSAIPAGRRRRWPRSPGPRRPRRRDLGEHRGSPGVADRQCVARDRRPARTAQRRGVAPGAFNTLLEQSSNTISTVLRKRAPDPTRSLGCPLGDAPSHRHLG